MATPAGAPPAANPAPARAPGVPPNFVWNGQFWVAPPDAPPVPGGYSTLNAQGQNVNPDGSVRPVAAGDGSGAFTSPSSGNPLAALAGQIPGVKQLVSAATPATLDTSPLRDAQKRTADTQDFYRGRLVNLPTQYDPAHSAQLYSEGQGAISDLTAASKGLVPSAAELQLQQQAATNAARNFGAATALQGRSPGAALRMATTGATDTQAAANAQAAQLRAQEQAQARGQLVQAIGGQQQAEQGLRTGDTQQTGQLIQADIGALDANTKAAGGVVDANAKAAAGHDALTGQLWGVGTKALGL